MVARDRLAIEAAKSYPDKDRGILKKQVSVMEERIVEWVVLHVPLICIEQAFIKKAARERS